MAQRLRFTARYDHRWPSRAMTLFPEGWEGLVKDEVADVALAKGKAVVVTSLDEPPAETADDGRPDGLAQSDHADDVGTGDRVQGDAAAGKRPRARKH